MILLIVAVVVVLSLTALTAHTLTLRTGKGRDDTTRAWITAHHWTVAAIAVTAVVAALLPSDLLGRADPSDPWGGHLGRYVMLAVIWTVLMLPVTVTARVVVTRSTSAPVRRTMALVAWVLLLAGGVVVLTSL